MLVFTPCACHSKSRDQFSEDLDAVVLSVAHKDVAVGHNGDALKALELPVAGSPASEGPQESAVGVEDLNSVVAAVRHKNVILVVDSDAPWEFELSFSASF